MGRVWHLSDSVLTHVAHTQNHSSRPPHGMRRFAFLNVPPPHPVLPPRCRVPQVDGDEESEEEEDVGMGDIDVEAGPALTVDV